MAEVAYRSNRVSRFYRHVAGISTFQKVVICLSLALLITSLTQPAFYIDRNDPDAYANAPYLFFLGWLSFIGGGVETIIWLANPFYFLALFLFIYSNRLAVIFGAFTVVLSLFFAILTSINTDESGGSVKIASLENGYKLWVASFIVLLAGIVINDAVAFIRSSSSG